MDALNLVSYFCVDDNNEVCQQGMGRTLNVSEGGILLETHAPIDEQLMVSLRIGLEDDLADIQGIVVHSRKAEGNHFQTGIKFQEITDDALRVLRDYIEAFTEQQKQR